MDGRRLEGLGCSSRRFHCATARLSSASSSGLTSSRKSRIKIARFSRHRSHAMRWTSHADFTTGVNTPSRYPEIRSSVRHSPFPVTFWLFTICLPIYAVSYTHLRAHETPEHLVCRLLLEKKKLTF